MHLNPLRLFMFVITALFAGSMSWGHHAMIGYDFELDKPLEGRVTAVQWINPHCLMRMSVQDEVGRSVDWEVEFGTPNLNLRNGWRKTDIRPGDTIAIVVHPLKNGEPRATLVSLRHADGRVLYGQGSDRVAQK